MSNIQLIGANLLDWQKTISSYYLYSDYKTLVINASRQIGKSVLLTQLCLHSAINNKNVTVGVISLTYKQTKIIYNAISRFLKKTPIVDADLKSELKIELVNGSTIQFFTIGNPDNIRGFTFDYLFCDEFAYYPDEVWEEVIQPTILVRGKRTFIVSTPRGTANSFYKLFNLGLDKTQKNIVSFQYDWTHGLLDESEIDLIRKQIPEPIFKQEYMGQFTDGASIFTNLNDIALLEDWPIKPEPNNKYYAGIDVGLFSDFTVVIIIDSKGRIVDILRIRLASITNTQTEVLKFLKKWQPELTIIETNNQGIAIYEYLKLNLKKRVDPFTTTNESKNEIINLLQSSIEDKLIQIPTVTNFQPLYNELQNFGFSYSPKTKKIIYGGISGFHDDTVISLALANKVYQTYHGVKKSTFGYRMKR